MFAMDWFVKSCQELVYGQKYDGTLRTALKRPEPILEVLEHEVVKLVLENITKQSKLERGEPLDTRVQLVPTTARLAACPQPKPAPSTKARPKAFLSSEDFFMFIFPFYPYWLRGGFNFQTVDELTETITGSLPPTFTPVTGLKLVASRKPSAAPP